MFQQLQNSAIRKILSISFYLYDKEPVILQLNEKFFSISESGTLRAEISFPASGYISGQSIPITIDVVNDTNVRVNQIQIILKRKEKYIFHKGDQYLVEKSFKNIAETVVDGVVEARCSSKQKLQFDIPPLQPAFKSEAISWHYELKV